LEVSRSYIPERFWGDGKPRIRYQKAEDAGLLVSVRKWVDERPAYGYRRIAVLTHENYAQV